MGSSKASDFPPLHHPAYIKLAEAMKRWREDAGLSQRALAAKLGQPDSYVGKCERRDRRIDPIELAAWCNVCGVGDAELLKQIRWHK